MKAHKENTANFGELSFSQQVRSINGQINGLERMIRHHLSNYPEKREKRRKIILVQIARLIGQI